MQTYIKKREIVDNPNFLRQRKKAVSELDFNIIDAPIADLIKDITRLPYCFTLQSCVGHFIFGEKDIHNLEPLDKTNDVSEIEYGIAYIAFCIDNDPNGVSFLNDMERVAEIEKDYIQFGSATWFWDQEVNSYVLQVQPERLKDQDKMIIDIKEACHIAEVKNKFYARLNQIIRQRLIKRDGKL